MNVKNVICTILGMAGAAVSEAFGGWSSALTTLIIFMGLDYITGIVVAGVFKASNKSSGGGLESKAGWKGLMKKGVTLVIVLASARLDMLIGTNYIKDAVIIAFCANELISIIENAGLMGVPIPSTITKAIEVLKEKGDKDA
jgi:toxin secretion/phage lysis holin